MVPGFSRSISLPLNPAQKGFKASYHVRSISLPCRSHPLISHLEEQIRAVRSWLARSDGSAIWITSGLAPIDLLLSAVIEFLHLTEVHDVLRRSGSADRLVDDSLLLADSYGSFLSEIVSLKQQQSETQAACRRGDSARLLSSVRSQRRIEKEISQLASALKGVSKCSPLTLGSDASEAEIVGILRETISATVSASAALFSGVVAMSAAISSVIAGAGALSLVGTVKKLALNSSFKKRISEEEREMDYSQRFGEFDECIQDLESGSERVFRSLVRTRVFLLNIQTPSF